MSKEGVIRYNDTSLPYSVGKKALIQELIDEDEWFQEEYKDVKKEYFILEGKQGFEGYVLYLIPVEEYAVFGVKDEMLRCTIPIAVGIMIIVFGVFVYLHQMHKKVLQPIKEISQSSKEIIKGNYDLEVVRTYDSQVAENEIGDLIFSFELMRDELKEKQLREEALKHSQQELISCISHDLRTPISTIKAYTEGLRDGIADSKDKQILFHKIILEKVNLLSGMIEELLEYSNTQLNQLSIIKEELYFNTLWHCWVTELEVYVRQQDGVLIYNTPIKDVLVNVDPKRIQEVL